MKNSRTKRNPCEHKRQTRKHTQKRSSTPTTTEFQYALWPKTQVFCLGRQERAQFSGQKRNITPGIKGGEGVDNSWESNFCLLRTQVSTTVSRGRIKRERNCQEQELTPSLRDRKRNSHKSHLLKLEHRRVGLDPREQTYDLMPFLIKQDPGPSA